MTTQADQNALAVMVASIYAARLSAYMAFATTNTEAFWRPYRDACIQRSITDAVAICEAVNQDFPLSEA